MRNLRSILTPIFAAVLLATHSVCADDSIIFSKPADLPTEKANSFMDQAPRKLQDSYTAPSPLFGNGQVEFDRLPGPQPTPQLTGEQFKQWQKMLDQRKNWTLLTPEELLGLPTPEKIFGLPESESEQRLTVEERYIRRQDRLRATSATNAMRQAGGLMTEDENLFQRRADGQQSFGQDLRPGQSGRNNYFGQPASALAGQGNNSAVNSAAKGGGNFWKSGFNPQPQVVDRREMEQAAALAQIRALMEPPAPAKPSVAADIYHSVTPVRDPNMQVLPTYNQNGNTFRPVANSVGRPIGIMPLPDITGTRPSTSVPEKRKPLVELPPWLEDKKKPPTTPPVRKF